MTAISQNININRGSFYRRNQPKPIDTEAVRLNAAIRHIHADVDATYGSRRMQSELHAQGFNVGRYKVRSLMKALALKAKRPKAHRYPSSGQASVIAPSRLNQQFNPNLQNTHWSGDTTYIRTQQGWLYLVIVLDLYSRRVVSWPFSSQPNSELSKRALQLAVAHRNPPPSVMFHTDQGVQYSSEAFQQSLRANNITASMSLRGNCLDNAVTERFFRSLKSRQGSITDNTKRGKRQCWILPIILSRFTIVKDGIQHWATFLQ